MFDKIKVKPFCYGNHGNIHYNITVYYHNIKKQNIKVSACIDDGVVFICRCNIIEDRKKVIEAIKLYFMDFHVAINEKLIGKRRNTTTADAIKLAAEMGLISKDTEKKILDSKSRVQPHEEPVE